MKYIVWSVFVAVILTSISFMTIKDYGITWDEPIYFSGAGTYISWMKHPQMSTRDAAFRIDEHRDIHPPFVKLIAGITHELFTNTFQLFNNTMGYRSSVLVFVFFGMMLFTYVAIRMFSTLIGIGAACCLYFLPHIFFLTHVVTLDYAVMMLWFITVVSVMKGCDDKRFFVFAGMTLGLSFLTKLHGFLLCIPLCIYWIWYNRTLFRKRKFTLFFQKIVKEMGLVFGIACAVMFIFWPWLWTSPIQNMQEYFSVQLSHGDIPVYFLGNLYTHAPWYYTPFMFFATTPVFFCVVFSVGVIWIMFRGTEKERWMLVHMMIPLIFFSLPFVYRYDGVRLFLPAYPFAVLVAAAGIRHTIQSIKHIGIKIIIGWCIAGWSLWTVIASIVSIHPFEQSYYNEIIGGVDGAKEKGLELEYWGSSYLSVLPYMNAHKGTMFCVIPTTQPFYYYQAMGQIEGGVIFESGDACEYAVVLMRQGFFSQFLGITEIVADTTPLYAVTVSHTPIIGVYQLHHQEK